MTKQDLIKKYPVKLAETSLAIAKKRYMKTDEKGNIVETPSEMFYRVAEFISSADKIWNKKANLEASTEEFYKMIANFEFTPGGRIYFEAGNNHTGQMAHCFVVPIEDDLEKIFESLRNAAIIQQHNGGTGFNFSKIRPSRDSVKGINGIAAGPIHYLRTFDTALSRVLQGSKRHGGNMGVLNIDHPDIEEFINVKLKDGDIKNFNISVGVTDEFMEKVRCDEEFNLVNPRNNEIVKTVRAKDLFNKIITNAYNSADPGLLFLDRIEEDNNNPHLGKLQATNPCGEQPLLDYESCNLGSVILHNHVKEGRIDWDKMAQTIKTATRFMDNIIELNKFPLEIIEENVKKTRKIGIGVVGFAHMLYKLGVAYNSQKAVDLMEEVMKFIYENVKKNSIELAKTRGVFTAWKGSKWEERNIKIHNSHFVSIAPTGTVSLLVNTSSGVEPVFSLVNIRKVFLEDSNNKGEDSAVLRIVDPVLEENTKRTWIIF